MELETKNVRYSQELAAGCPYIIERNCVMKKLSDLLWTAKLWRNWNAFPLRCEGAIQSCSEYQGPHYASWQLRVGSLPRHAPVEGAG